MTIWVAPNGEKIHVPITWLVWLAYWHHLALVWFSHFSYFCVGARKTNLTVVQQVFKLMKVSTTLKSLFHENSILLHSGLNPAWHFWLSNKIFCCLKLRTFLGIFQDNCTDFREPVSLNKIFENVQNWIHF